jgi:hypothetical protein
MTRIFDPSLRRDICPAAVSQFRRFRDIAPIDRQTLLADLRRMRRILSFVLMILLSANVASAWDITWADQYGNGSLTSSAGAAVDATGVYVAGSVVGPPLPGQSAAGGTDAYIRKYDFAGHPIWTRQYGTPGPDFVLGIAANASGVYTTGRTTGTLPGQTSAGNADAFVRKFSPGGDVLWTRQFGTAAFDAPMLNGVAAHSTGVYVAGVTEAAFPGAAPGGGEDIFVARLDAASGQVLWIRQFGTRGLQFRSSIGGVTVDDSGVYAAGIRLVGDAAQSVVRRYDFDGNLIWTRQLEGAGACVPTFWGLSAYASNLYVVGQWNEDFFDGACRNSASHVVGALLKYDADGNLVWRRRIKGSSEGISSFTGAKTVAASATGVYVAANLTSTFPGFISDGPDSDHSTCPGSAPGNQFTDSLDAYVRKYDFDGDVIWTHQFGSNVFDLATGLATDATSVYVPVDTSCHIDGEPFSGGFRDVFLARMDAHPTSIPGQVQLIVGRLETIQDANRLTAGEFNSLVKKLETALRFLESGGDAGTADALRTFIDAVGTFGNRGTLSNAEAGGLIAAANGILDQL